MSRPRCSRRSLRRLLASYSGMIEIHCCAPAAPWPHPWALSIHFTNPVSSELPLQGCMLAEGRQGTERGASKHQAGQTQIARQTSRVTNTYYHSSARLPVPRTGGQPGRGAQRQEPRRGGWAPGRGSCYHSLRRGAGDRPRRRPRPSRRRPGWRPQAGRWRAIPSPRRSSTGS